MPPVRLAALLSTICAALAGGAILGGCGGQTTTVTAAGEPGAAATASTAAPAATAPGTASGQTTAPAPPTSTRTGTEPAFTGGSSPGAGAAAAAAALVRAHGYTPTDTAEYHPDHTLEVLVGTRTGSGDGYNQRAFFFLDGRYLGTDAKEPSAALKVLSQSDTEVTISYPLYRRNDPLCCPGGGQTKVRFQLDNGRLVPLDAIPPASSASGLSRN